MTSLNRRDLGRVFNEVPDLYDRVASLERIRTVMGDRAARRYLSVLRIGQRAD